MRRGRMRGERTSGMNSFGFVLLGELTVEQIDKRIKVGDIGIFRLASS
jgi:hypothetical protein